MKTTKPAVILLALVLLTATGAQSAEKSGKAKKISGTYVASCLVKITTDSSVLPLNEFAVDYLLGSSGVAGKPAREILNMSPDIASELFEIEEVFTGDSSLGGFGMPLGTTVPGRRSPTPARTPTRPTTRTARTGSTTPRPTPPTRPTPRRKPTVLQPQPSTTDQTILFHLRVDFSDASGVDEYIPAAQEFMVALIDNLRIALREAFDQYSAKLNNQLLLADTEAQRAESDLVQMQARLRDISGSHDLSRNVILRNISVLRQKLQTNMMDMTSYKSTIEATTKRIAETKVQIKEKLSYDTVAHKLQKIIDIHEEQVRRLESKGRHEPETAEARENLAKAEVELAKRREELSNSAGGNLLSTLNQVLADASMQENEAMGQIKNLQKQIAEAEQLLSSADEYELVSLKADIARQGLEETLLWRARLGRNNRSVQPPDVTVIGAE